jgi:uncharacterized cupin superfamily protein
MEPHPGVFCSTVRTGEWEPDPIYVLEGEVRIEITGGPALTLKPGDLASLPAGLETIWHITPPFTELWVLA